MITDGWLIGAASAQAMTERTDIDTGVWKPGRADAANERVDALGLGRDLAAAQATGRGAQDVAHGYLISLGRALVEGAAAGQSAKVTGATLVSILGDTTHAASVALGVLVVAIGQAAMAWYRQRQIAYGRWLTAQDPFVCSRCLANEAAGRVPIGASYPSSDVDAPAHDRCRCQVIPD